MGDPFHYISAMVIGMPLCLAIFAACGNAETAPGPVDRCPSDLALCPADSTDSCGTGAPVIGECCYLTIEGDLNPIEVCAAPSDAGACYTCAEGLIAGAVAEVSSMLCSPKSVDAWNGVEVCYCAGAVCFASCSMSLCSGRGPDATCSTCMNENGGECDVERMACASDAGAP